MSITGLPGQGPVRVGIPIADLTAGLFCALGIMTALLEREVSGEGQWVSTSLLQAQIFMLDFQASRFLTEGQVPKQAGNNHPTTIPTGVFKTKDGHLNIAVDRRGDLGALLQRGRPSGVDQPRPTTRPASCARKNRDTLNAEIDKATATKPAPSGSTSSTRSACHAGRSIRSIRCSPIRRSSISASRRNPRAPTAAGSASSASRSSCRARRARSRRGRRISASTPTRFSRNSVSAPMKSRRCTSSKAV